MDIPVDPTQTEAWAKLIKITSAYTPDFRRIFAEDPQRTERYSRQAADLFVDLSKGYLDKDVLAALPELVEETGTAARRDAIYAGEHINITENRAVLHAALCRPAADELAVDGQNVVVDVREVLEKVYGLARCVRSGEWAGTSGKPIRIVVNVDIDGLDLGPVMVYETLKPYVKKGLERRSISSIDPTDVGERLHGLDLETTLSVIASKTLTTLEILTNVRVCRVWLLGGLAERGVGAEGTASKHFVAVSTNLGKVAELDIDPTNAYGFWGWAGRRYSVGSAVGMSLAIAIGPENSADFLSGFGAIDEHFEQAPVAQNIPLLTGPLNVWYTNFFGAVTHVVLPYSQYPHRFPTHLR